MGEYVLYFYLFPSYIRTKESYCSILTSIDMRHLTTGKVLVPNQIDPERVWGFEFHIGPTDGLSDSCATFEVGPIYLK